MPKAPPAGVSGGRTSLPRGAKAKRPDPQEEPDFDLKAVRLAFDSGYEGVEVQELAGRKSIGFQQTATLHAGGAPPGGMANAYEFRQEVRDAYVAYFQADDGSYQRDEQPLSNWEQDGDFEPDYDADPEMIRVGASTITFEDHPGWSGQKALPAGQWLASYRVMFRWKVKRKDAGRTWTTQAVIHELTCDFDPENPVERRNVTGIAAGSRNWEKNLT
jgi:hypothetical protein